MTAGPEFSEEDIALAGEYALDLLTAAERQAFEQRLADEPQLRLLVLDWDEGLAPLTDDVPDVEPPALVRARIDARLFGTEAAAGKRGWFRPWMGAVGGALAAAAVVAAVVFTDPAAPILPTHRAEIAPNESVLRASASLDAENGTIAVSLLAGGARPNRTLQLWLIVEGDNTPKSLGLLGDDTTDLALAAEYRDKLDGALLAISDEPPGGSPTGAPTGAVLAIGTVSAL